MRYAEAEAVNFLNKIFIFNWSTGPTGPDKNNFLNFHRIRTGPHKNSFTKIMDTFNWEHAHEQIRF